MTTNTTAAPTSALGQALTENNGSDGDLVGDPDLGLRFGCALVGLRLRRQRHSFRGRELVDRGQQVVLWPESEKRTLTKLVCILQSFTRRSAFHSFSHRKSRHGLLENVPLPFQFSEFRACCCRHVGPCRPSGHVKFLIENLKRGGKS